MNIRKVQTNCVHYEIYKNFDIACYVEENEYIAEATDRMKGFKLTHCVQSQSLSTAILAIKMLIDE